MLLCGILRLLIKQWRGQANILIDSNLRVQLMDFGLALFADSTLTSSRAGGAIRWVSPQLLRGSVPRPSYSCDMYSYGCVCVEVGRFRGIMVRNI